MNHFGSTFILCFFGFLFIQANAIQSWKTCSAHSDCQASGEYCEYLTVKGEPGECVYCVHSDPSDSIDDSVPTWCSDYTKFKDVNENTFTSSSVLTFVKQAGWQNEVSLCPSFDACTQNCRKEYSVEKTTTQVTLTSTFTDTTDCVCEQVTFIKSEGGWKSASTNFGTVADTVELYQYSTGALDINIWQENVSPITVDCVWEYSIGTSSSPAATLTGLFGLISASVVAFVLL